MIHVLREQNEKRILKRNRVRSKRGELTVRAYPERFERFFVGQEPEDGGTGRPLLEHRRRLGMMTWDTEDREIDDAERHRQSEIG